MSIKHKIKIKKIDRDRGTYSATGDSLDLSDEGISKPEQRLSASDGESARRGVPADDMKQPTFVNEDAEYCKYLAKLSAHTRCNLQILSLSYYRL